jgi:hypothetical protein
MVHQKPGRRCAPSGSSQVGRLRPSRGSAQPNQFANPALSGMNDPNPFLPVILTSTTLLLAAMAVAVTLI